MSRYNSHRHMILMVAQALGEKLLSQVAFVGGCTTGLFITDEMTRESIRYTDDVDLIVKVLGYSGWHTFSEQLVAAGFSISMNDEINCRFRLGDLQVDFIPDEENVLGFTNRWYKSALQTAQPYQLNNEIRIRLVTPEHFLATKFEAFKGRGNSDLLASRDIEDILNIVDGRSELYYELTRAAAEIKSYLASEFTHLLKSAEIAYAVQSTAGGDPGREQLIFERMENIAAIKLN